MKIEEIWVELEREALGGSSGGWLTRFARPDPAQPLYVALNTASMRRAILLPILNSAMPSKEEWPAFRGLRVFSGTLGGAPFLGVSLENTEDSEVFSALAEDIAPRVAGATTSKAAATILLGRLRHWQKFLAAYATGLGPDAQRGLYAELVALRTLLSPVIGIGKSVAAWVGPARAHQDFQCDGVAIEVKCTAAQAPPVVRISSARQLDDVGVRDLFLYVLAIDERLGSAPAETGSESLPEAIRIIRDALSSDSLASETFEDKLLEAGYLNADSTRYDNRRFTARRVQLFHIREGFPRVVESDLPLGIGDITYSLSLAACSGFEVLPQVVDLALRR